MGSLPLQRNIQAMATFPTSADMNSAFTLKFGFSAFSAFRLLAFRLLEFSFRPEIRLLAFGLSAIYWLFGFLEFSFQPEIRHLAFRLFGLFGFSAFGFSAFGIQLSP